jgi:hypothetical protein
MISDMTDLLWYITTSRSFTQSDLVPYEEPHPKGSNPPSPLPEPLHHRDGSFGHRGT